MEYAERNYMIAAVDFDGTLCRSAWPDIGEANLPLIERLQRFQARGNKLILWTCRAGRELEAAVEWCTAHGLIFDAVNDNLPEIVAQYRCNSRKISCDFYIDDRLILPRDLLWERAPA